MSGTHTSSREIDAKGHASATGMSIKSYSSNIMGNEKIARTRIAWGRDLKEKEIEKIKSGWDYLSHSANEIVPNAYSYMHKDWKERQFVE